MGLPQLLVLSFLPACTLLFESPHAVRDASPESPDASSDASPMCVCSDAVTWEVCPLFYDPCAFNVQADDLILTSGSYFFDTTDMSLSNSLGVPVAVVAETITQTDLETKAVVITADTLNISVDATLYLRGPHPVIFNVRQAEIPGTIDASSRRNEAVGAGSPSPFCSDTSNGATGQALDPSVAGGGGGGGGNAEAGAAGGGSHPPEGDELGGTAGSPIVSAALTGGCAGGDGATDTAIELGGVGGAGGGAFQVSALEIITVGGSLYSGGAGGDTPPLGSRGGGGGGGSGGTIMLSAPMVVFLSTARILAIGGGGAEGGDTTQATPNVGFDGVLATDPPVGGNAGMGGNPAGGDGGRAGNGSTAGGAIAGKTGTEDGGGGGGGGSVGVFRVRGMTSGSPQTALPPAT